MTFIFHTKCIKAFSFYKSASILLATCPVQFCNQTNTEYMVLLVDYIYTLVVATIRGYKWLELCILNLFSSLVQKLFIYCAENWLGVIFHLPGEPAKEFSEKEEKRILANCGYTSLLHVKLNNLSIIPRTVNIPFLTMGEGYVDGEWETFNGEEDITELAYRVFDTNLYTVWLDWWPVNRLLNYVEHHAFNLQTVKRAFEVGEKHYDLGNNLFESFLDPWMQYTCGYWAKADNLNDAQLHKMELIAKKLELKPGMRVLDVGCGWGTLCKYLAENYGVECVGITVSKEGVVYAEEKCKGLKTEFRVQDYRDLNEKFDRILSIGMFEHVGYHNYRKYFEVLHKCLKDDGIFLLHTIGVNHKNMVLIEPFTHKYIFPNGHLPYYKHITEKTEGLFIIEDWHNFGLDYVKTLEAWRNNFRTNWPTISDKYGDRFYRLWNVYLSSAALYKSRRSQLWQIVLTKDGLQREYRAAR